MTNYFGITKINWSRQHDFVKKVLIHKITRCSESHKIRLSVGTAMKYNEVAALIDKGFFVYVMVNEGSEHYTLGDLVGIIPGEQDNYLESVDEAGNPTDSLYDLPLWVEK